MSRASVVWWNSYVSPSQQGAIFTPFCDHMTCHTKTHTKKWPTVWGLVYTSVFKTKGKLCCSWLSVHKAMVVRATENTAFWKCSVETGEMLLLCLCTMTVVAWLPGCGHLSTWISLYVHFNCVLHIVLCAHVCGLHDSVNWWASMLITLLSVLLPFLCKQAKFSKRCHVNVKLFTWNSGM